MSKRLVFKNDPTLEDLKGLEINGKSFEKREGHFTKNGIVLHVPETFRFGSCFEIVYSVDRKPILVLTQFLTRGLEYWDMGDAFGRIEFRDPEIERQLRNIVDQMVSRELAYWEEL